MMMMTEPQDAARRPGNTTVESHPTPSAKPVAPSARRSGTTSFSPRWGRVAVALVGLVALGAALVTLVLGALGSVSLLVPAACIGLAAAAVVTLRLLAVRSRRARVDRAFAAAMAPVRVPPLRNVPAAPAAPQRPTALFDAEEASTRPLTAMELRTAALAVAHGSSAVSVSSEALLDGTAAASPSGATAWAPVAVPRPTYVDAAKAERQAPAPLDLPEAPKPTSKTPIKASEAAARAAAATGDTEEAPVDAAPSTGRINLDDVLQRRRA